MLLPSLIDLGNTWVTNQKNFYRFGSTQPDEDRRSLMKETERPAWLVLTFERAARMDAGV